MINPVIAVQHLVVIIVLCSCIFYFILFVVSMTGLPLVLKFLKKF